MADREASTSSGVFELASKPPLLQHSLLAPGSVSTPTQTNSHYSGYTHRDNWPDVLICMEGNMRLEMPVGHLVK